MIAVVLLLFVGGLAFFGFKATNQSNIHSYEEGTPEQREALKHSFGPRQGTPPGQAK